MAESKGYLWITSISEMRPRHWRARLTDDSLKCVTTNSRQSLSETREVVNVKRFQLTLTESV